MTQQHAATPWKIGFLDGFGIKEFFITGPDDIVVVAGWGDCCQDEANARFIVQACNAHDDMVAACKAVLPAIQWGMTHQPGNMNQWLDVEAQIEAAITQATSPQVR